MKHTARNRSLVGSLVATVGLAGAALGQARVEMQVSQAGAESWGSSVNGVAGTAIDVRMRVSYTGTASPLGLASMYAQPTISNWRSTGNADTMTPLVNGGLGSNISSPIGGVLDGIGQYGRVLPYANRATNGVQALTGHVQAITGVTYLRIAQGYATDWVGTGFNATGGRGIPLTQVNDVGRTAAEPVFNTSLQNIVVFKFRINLSPDATNRVMQVTVPPEGFGNLNTTTGVREVRWFASMIEATGSLAGAATVIPANIIIPAPAGMTLLGLGGLVVRRRRR